MAGLDVAKNFARVEVSIGYNSAATTIVLTTGDGAKLGPVPFNVVWWDKTNFTDPSLDPNVEVVRVTAISTDTLTVTRAQEGTTATNKNTGGAVYNMIAGLTAKTVNAYSGHVVYMPATWPAMIGKIQATGGNVTTGVKMIVTAVGQSIAGLRVGWPGGQGAKTVLVTLWNLGSTNTGGSSLGTATVAVNAAGLYEAFFSSPIAVTQWNYYTMAMWDNSGAVWISITSISDGPSTAGNDFIRKFPYPDGPAVIIQTNLFDGGNVQPTTGLSTPTVVEPIFL